MNNRFFVLVLACIFAIAILIHAISDSQSVTLIKEILVSHVDEIVVEENETNFYELSLKMTGLKFKLVEAQNIDLDELRMIGAKYFNQDEIIGAQIKFRATDKSVVTLYEFQTDSELENIDSIIKVDEKKYRAKLWNEDGTYFLLVRSL